MYVSGKKKSVLGGENVHLYYVHTHGSSAIASSVDLSALIAKGFQCKINSCAALVVPAGTCYIADIGPGTNWQTLSCPFIAILTSGCIQ